MCEPQAVKRIFQLLGATSKGWAGAIGRDESDFKSPPGSKTTLGRSRAERGRSMWREEKMQFCADIGMSGRRRREKGGMGENKGAWNDFDRVRCQNTMIRSLTRIGRRANRGERKAPSLGQKGRLALIRADRAPNQDFLGFVVRPSLFSSRTRTSQVKKPITHSLTLIHPSSFGSR